MSTPPHYTPLFTPPLRAPSFVIENESPFTFKKKIDERSLRRHASSTNKIKLDYKNTQLLSQFISPYTGRMYGRHVTGLCLHMQRRVAREARIANLMGFLPFMNKRVKYLEILLEDPMLSNPFSRKTCTLLLNFIL
ncbi:hypothetical protein DPMN_080442 [Dreissena polymorpha]|uniref:Ribosomal protein S18 n=1 Tax=Dreissena polymorpha TaxID=45954 RepID=A0A9D3YRE1_DREPO|nr:hypothetical protein DPMN_080442 [Dreissena polymorpha]